MSDTPPYPEATVEAAARAGFESERARVFGPGCGPSWDEVDEVHRVWARDSARAVLNALAAAGRLLPEGAIREHAVRYLNTGTVTHPVSSAESARLISKAWRDDGGIECEPVVRLVGPWSAVPPEPKEGA